MQALLTSCSVVPSCLSLCHGADLWIVASTGNHSFYLSASNIAALQLQSVSNSTAARNIINTTTSCSSFFCSREQQSQPQLLVAGQQYLLKVQHLQWDAQTWLGVAATIPSAAVRCCQLLLAGHTCSHTVSGHGCCASFAACLLSYGSFAFV